MLFFSSFSDFKIFQGLGNEELWRRLVSVIHTTTIFWGAAYLFRKSSATIASKVASEVEKGAFTYNSKIPAPLSLSPSLYIQNVQYVFARVSPSHSHRYRISIYTWKCLVGFPHCIILFEKYGHRERRTFAERLKSEYWIFKHVRCTRSFRPSIALKFYSLSCSWLNPFANWRKIPQMVWVARALFRMTGKLKRPRCQSERSIKMVVGNSITSDRHQHLWWFLVTREDGYGLSKDRTMPLSRFFQKEASKRRERETCSFKMAHCASIAISRKQILFGWCSTRRRIGWRPFSHCFSNATLFCIPLARALCT